jgi:hypothetical protein
MTFRTFAGKEVALQKTKDRGRCRSERDDVLFNPKTERRSK